MTKKALKQKGFFVVIEGGDYSGKDTLAVGLSDLLVKDGHRVFKTQEPDDSAIGKEIRAMSVIDSEDHPMHQFGVFLQRPFIMQRFFHNLQIMPQLWGGCIVICVRYHLSTFVYGTLSGRTFDEIINISNQIIGEAKLIPDLTLVLDISVATAEKRITDASRKREIWESREKMEKINAAYRELRSRDDLASELGPIETINAELPFAEVVDIAYKHVVESLKKQKESK